MRNKIIIVGGLALSGLLSGCAVDSVSTALSEREGVVLKSTPSGIQFFDGINLNRPAVTVNKDTMSMCLLSSLSNDTITLKSSAGSFVGAYTGNYYQANQQREAGGGQVIKYVSDDGDKAAANGLVKSSALWGIETAVRFQLQLYVDAGKTSYNVSNIQQAQINTGTATNDGFDSIGAWSGSSPDKAYDSIVSAIDSLQQCLARS